MGEKAQIGARNPPSLSYPLSADLLNEAAPIGKSGRQAGFVAHFDNEDRPHEQDKLARGPV